jgi:hypothetical protein
MLTIENFTKIEGEAFQLSNGKRFIIGIAKNDRWHYSFGVFPLMENNVANIKKAIVYELHKDKRNRRGYPMLSTSYIGPVYVRPENLTLKNFILELHIQTAKICSQ